jgi:uncharacterized RDD family membrane protein YckC
MRRLLNSARPNGNVHGHYAGFISRGLAFGIDLLLVALIALVGVWLVRSTLGLFNIDLSACRRYVPLSGLDALVHNLCRTARGSIYLFGTLLPPIYFFLFWLLAGETVGQGIVGVRVVAVDGRRLTVRSMLLRLVGYALSILPLGLGFLWSLADERRQGWHDKLAGTYVIYWRQPRMVVNEPAAPPQDGPA